MALVSIDGDNLIVEMEGLDKLWSLKSRLHIPLVNVRGATADPGVAAGWKGIRAAGTHLLGAIIAGTFFVDGDRVFWDVHDPTKAVVIELADEVYARLIVEVADPRETVELVNGGIVS